MSQFREGSLNLKLGRPMMSYCKSLKYANTWRYGPTHHPERWIPNGLGASHFEIGRRRRILGRSFIHHFWWYLAGKFEWSGPSTRVTKKTGQSALHLRRNFSIIIRLSFDYRSISRSISHPIAHLIAHPIASKSSHLALSLNYIPKPLWHTPTSLIY